MSMICWLMESDILRYKDSLIDKDIKSLLKELNSKTGESWIIQQRQYDVGRLWWKKTVDVFCIYYHIKCVDWQIINLYKSEKNSLNIFNDKIAIINYLMGYVNGLDHNESLI